MVREPETPAPTDEPVMKLASVSKFFSGVPALENISLEILPGEVHALLGENGAGKSTLMNIATGTLQPTGGDIFIDGQIVDSLNPGLAADLGIAIVHQHPALMPDLTVLENFLVALPRDVFHRKTPKPDVVKGLLSAVGLEMHGSSARTAAGPVGSGSDAAAARESANTRPAARQLPLRSISPVRT